MDKITIERETLNAAMMALEYLLEASPVMTTKHRDAYSTAARLRAALAAQPAEPVGDVVVSCNEDGQIVAVTRQDDEGRILSVIAEAQPAPSHRAPSHRLSDARMDGIYNAWRDMGDDVSYGDLMRMVEAEIQGGK